jgi:uncharacterized repeat protein (TIGR03803 family)
MRKHLIGLLTIAVSLALSAHAQTYTESTLHAYTTANPVGTLTADSAGNLYGALDWTGSCAPGKTGVDCGLIFKLNSAGQETVLHKFTVLANGASPVAPLTRDSAGNLYGVTKEGGHTSGTFAYGLGTIFKINPQGKFSILHQFAASGAEGALPVGPLTLDSTGNLYGTTEQGGSSSSSCASGCGVVFKLTPKGVFSVLQTFTEPEGFLPRGNLILDSAGNIYGTTDFGGPVGGFNPSDGVLFELTPKGDETVLYSFNTGQCGDGCNGSYIVRDSQGNFFGSGYNASPDFDAGGIFEISASDAESFSYYFCPGVDNPCPNGALPFGQIVESGGLLYGTTETGGGATQQEFGQGVVYELNPSTATENVLYAFPTQSGGLCNPQGITMDAKGNLYGTATYCYGVTGGVVFKLTKH